MYFPLYRGKQYELIALRDLAVRIATEGGVIPIIEPVRDNATTRLSFDHFLATNLRFILIVNPRVGRRNGILTPDIVHNNLIQAGLADYDNYLPALYVGPAATVQEVEGFLQRYEETPEITFIFDGEVTNPALLEILHNVPNAPYYIFKRNRTSTALQNSFPAQSRVLIGDYFEREDRNADYPEDQLFTDQVGNNIGDVAIAGVGDYSIAGSAYTEGGGAAYAVALHHVYYRNGLGSPLHVRHFISDRTETTVDPGGKFLEALAKLVVALPALGVVNHTPTCDEYLQLHADQRFPQLGYVKKMALKHHLELLIGH